MEEKKKLKITANKKIVTFSLIALVLLMIVSTSYAYFTATITGNDTAKKTTVTTGTMGLKLNGNTQVGMASAMPGESATITFSVENTGTLATTYALNLDQVTNNFVDKNDLVYTITSTNNGGSKTETVLPSENGVLIPVVSIEPNVTQEYTMTIIFKETNNNQNDNQGKTFTGRVQIESLDNNKLASKIMLSNEMHNNEPTSLAYAYGEPTNTVGVAGYNYNEGVGTNSGTGIFATEDDLGTSYYLRGNIENNYVQFGTYDKGYTLYDLPTGNNYYYFDAINECPYAYPALSVEECLSQTEKIVGIGKKMIWRIVRINGDGSIRLVLDEAVDLIYWQNFRNEYGSVGYTYNNSGPNAQDGLPNALKQAVDYWYDNYFKNYENKLVDGDFCSDTSTKTENGKTYYGATSRLTIDENNIKPTLKCPETQQNFGGKYRLKVGMLSADEVVLSGVGAVDNDPSWDQRSWRTEQEMYMTPYNEKLMIGSDWSVTNAVVFNISPVINLKADTLIISGDGTKDNPYVIE